MMKYLIAGLGNPGAEYADTRHNIGFLVVDRIANDLGFSFSSRRYGDIAQGRYKGRQFTLLKPSTYMNLSGKAVRFWAKELEIPLEGILIITDDVALPVGKLRVRTQGSAGGHNGLTNIEELLGTGQYGRLRFGIGNDYPRGGQVDYVLGNWLPEERDLIQKGIERASSAALSFFMEGPEQAMTKYNKS